MTETNFEYRVKVTKAYPPDIRVFLSRIIPILVKHFKYPAHFYKKTALRCFEWGDMYKRCEDITFGEIGYPRVECERRVCGEMTVTDEWERTSMELLDFKPPFIENRVELRIQCSESFLATDKGDHETLIYLQTDSAILYAEIRAAIERILAKFKNALLEISEN